ncbi:hypothetical protein NDU88_005335 [Pleurodeles waltl]|uniref:Uncharacterized protein n=1 Tax=Pleurodeles waltl TaxID=8319 RepID=A0AAV7RM14_PLEWA|nr:hypothetical protein NDU88_005335 [Pleurodeles waltl]
MGTLTGAFIPDFRVFDRKGRTDSQEGEEEFCTTERKTNKERTPSAKKERLHLEETPDAENEQFHQEETTETRDGDIPKNPETKACESRHDPGGSWLSKNIGTQPMRDFTLFGLLSVPCSLDDTYVAAEEHQKSAQRQRTGAKAPRSRIKLACLSRAEKEVL